VFEALLEGLITEAVKQGGVDLSLVSVDSTIARASRPLARPAANRSHKSSRWLTTHENGIPQPGAQRHYSPQKREIVFTAYVTVTILGAVFNGAAAVTYLIGHEYPKTQADMKGIPRKYVPVLGMLLAAGTVGLLAGLAVPLLGTLAASGLVLYFIGAIIAHLRVGSRNIVGGIVFLATAAAALALGLVYHGPW
jgi:hypothetical protein